MFLFFMKFNLGGLGSEDEYLEIIFVELGWFIKLWNVFLWFFDSLKIIFNIYDVRMR